MSPAWRFGRRYLAWVVFSSPTSTGVTVLWQDGTRSLERLPDLIYAGRSTDPDPLSLPASHSLPDSPGPMVREAPPDWSYSFGVPTPGGGQSGPVDAGSFGGQAAARQGGRRAVLYDDAFRGARGTAVDNLRCDSIDPDYRRIRQSLVDYGIELRCGRLPGGQLATHPRGQHGIVADLGIHLPRIVLRIPGRSRAADRWRQRSGSRLPFRHRGGSHQCRGHPHRHR